MAAPAATPAPPPAVWSAFPVQVHYHPVTDTLQAKEVWGGSRPSTPMGFGTAGSASATVPSGSASMWSCANLTALATSGGAGTRWASMRSRGARARCTGAVSSSTRTAGATKEECLDGEAHGQGISVAPDGQRYEGGFRRRAAARARGGNDAGRRGLRRPMAPRAAAREGRSDVPGRPALRGGMAGRQAARPRLKPCTATGTASCGKLRTRFSSLLRRPLPGLLLLRGPFRAPFPRPPPPLPRVHAPGRVRRPARG